MPSIVVIPALLIAALLLATGHWRMMLWPFRIPARRMTVSRLELRVAEETDVERINTVLASFAGGFNVMLTDRRAEAWSSWCESLPVFARPFAHEGAAMAYIPRRLFRFDPADFERRVVKKHPGYCYLYYVGLGFWAGMRRYSPRRVEKLIEHLDPLHSQLAYDGYGFQTAFFDAPRDERALDRLRSFQGYAVNTAFQGVGRALWFRYLGDRRELHSRIDACGEYAADVAGGLGLATVFLNPDRLHLAQEVGRSLPFEWRAEFHLGMCFALKARSINDPVTFNEHLSNHDETVQRAARASLAACDRIEWETRDRHLAGGYRTWREGVRDWMAKRITFPLAGLEATGLSAATATPVAASAWE